MGCIAHHDSLGFKHGLILDPGTSVRNGRVAKAAWPEHRLVAAAPVPDSMVAMGLADVGGLT